jgi:hypothetical protein
VGCGRVSEPVAWRNIGEIPPGETPTLLYGRGVKVGGGRGASIE